MKADQDFSASAELDFTPLSAQEAKVWREKYGWSFVSIWQIVVLQIVVGCVLTAICWAIADDLKMVRSVAYGSLVVVLPSVVFARGVRRASASSGFRVFLIWELVKLILSVALLLMAPKLVADVDWLALLLSMIVVTKTYWVALLVLPHYKKPII